MRTVFGSERADREIKVRGKGPEGTTRGRERWEVKAMKEGGSQIGGGKLIIETKLK